MQDLLVFFLRIEIENSIKNQITYMTLLYLDENQDEKDNLKGTRFSITQLSTPYKIPIFAKIYR
jgi:hypothetical protein